MATTNNSGGISANRLAPDAYKNLFCDLHPALDMREAKVEAARCYFCHDAPCVEKCPTDIDIPMFIRQILTGNTKGAAKTIFEQNILGGMCARVCPTEQLCEEACVRNEADEKPVKIGMLQRVATDHLIDANVHPFARAGKTGKTVAVVGGGPAGLSCAHRLATYGHDVTIIEAKPKIGGLNEYGIAAYKTPDNFAQKEVNYVLSIGGITVRSGVRLGVDASLDDLAKEFDAVFLGLGMGAANSLGMAGEDAEGVLEAISYIGELRQADDLSALPIGANVVVIGGGMTAIDIAVQAKKLGAENVTIAYRRGAQHMKASKLEQELALTNGITIEHWANPVRLINEGGKVCGVEFERSSLDKSGRVVGTGKSFSIDADMVFKAIGQQFVAGDVPENSLKLEKGKISVNEECKTNLLNVWAGGDCIAGGDDLTVAAVQDGKVAAESINKFLTSGGK